MESMNPYDSPRADSQHGTIFDTGSVGTIASRFVFTPEHLVDTLERFRSQHPARQWWRWFRYFAALIFVLVALAGLFVPQHWVSAFMAALAIFMFFPHKIDDYLATRNFRKSPHCNAEQAIYLSDDGFRAESEIEQTTIKWSAFTNAVIFDDGVLLYRGPKLVNWIPDATLGGDDAAPKIRQLLAGKLPTRQAVSRSRRLRRI